MSVLRAAKRSSPAQRRAFMAMFVAGLLTPAIYLAGVKPVGRTTGRALLTKSEQIQVANSRDNRHAVVVAIDSVVSNKRSYEIYLSDSRRLTGEGGPILTVADAQEPVVAWDGINLLKIHLGCGHIQYFTNHWSPAPDKPPVVEIKLFSTDGPPPSGTSLGCNQR